MYKYPAHRHHKPHRRLTWLARKHSKDAWKWTVSKWLWSVAGAGFLVYLGLQLGPVVFPESKIIDPTVRVKSAQYAKQSKTIKYPADHIRPSPRPTEPARNEPRTKSLPAATKSPEQRVVSTSSQPAAAKPSASSQTVSTEEIKRYIGTKKWNISLAIAVFSCESHLNEKALNTGNSNGTWDAGVAQVNQVHGYSQEYLFHYKNNIDAAFAIYQGQGWNGWSCFKNNGYKKFLTMI